MLQTMRAAVIDEFGPAEGLRVRDIPVPGLGAGEVLVHVEVAGVGVWDVFEREGGYAQILGLEPRFPYVLGSEGAGTIARVGAGVSRFKTGDRVYAVGFLNPKGGFYAEYVAVHAGLVAPVPAGLTTEQAAVVGGVGLTALRGIEDVLRLRAGDHIAILGAGGGVGHVALQLAQRAGARVCALASGGDGVALARRLGADQVLDGRAPDLGARLAAAASGGFGAALLTAGGPAADAVVGAVREGGRVAYPNGIAEPPGPRDGVSVLGYNGEPDPDIFQRLERHIAAGPLEVHVGCRFPLEQVVAAHRALGGHYLGKVALHIG